MMSDIAIAQAAKLKPIREIAEQLDLTEDDLELYGKYKAKVNLPSINKRSGQPGKLVLVTGINPTPAGEGKSTLSVGLADGLRRRRHRVVLCLRQPSLGPVFGVNETTVQQQRSTLESTNRAVQANATTAWERLLAAAAAVQSLRDEVSANQVAFEGVDQEQRVGLRTVIDVLDAQQDLFTSQVNLVRARAVEVLASYQLRAATGRLTVQDLDLPVAPYEPETYYTRNRSRLFGLDGTG